jgi:hypothetical protein
MEPAKENIAIVEKFVEYCAKHLGLRGRIEIELRVGQQKGRMPTAGHYDPNNNKISVSIKNRAIADCLRTIAHELTHMRQLTVSEIIFPEDDKGLQPYEDEANLTAGRLVRFFGRENPEIYFDLA